MLPWLDTPVIWRGRAAVRRHFLRVEEAAAQRDALAGGVLAALPPLLMLTEEAARAVPPPTPCAPAPEGLALLILAGGRSRRMGADKAALPFFGTSLLAFQLEKARLLGLEEALISTGERAPAGADKDEQGGYPDDASDERRTLPAHPGEAVRVEPQDSHSGDAMGERRALPAHPGEAVRVEPQDSHSGDAMGERRTLPAHPGEAVRVEPQGIHPDDASDEQGSLSAPPLALRLIPDDLPRRGPLGGLAAALRRAHAPRVFSLPVDAPLFPSGEIARCAAVHPDAPVVCLAHGHSEAAEGKSRPSHRQANAAKSAKRAASPCPGHPGPTGEAIPSHTHPESADGASPSPIDEPLLALWRADLWPRIASFLQTGGGAVRAFTRTVNLARLDSPLPEACFINCNTPDEWRALFHLAAEKTP